MSLIDNMMEICVIMNKTRVADGEGGFVTLWAEGPIVSAAIVKDSTVTARVAEKQGMSSVYTVTTKKANALDFHDVIKRMKDGAIFRITSDASEKESPSISTLDMAQCTAERWELPQ